MILQYLSVFWTSFAPEVADHLWQSSAFVMLAAILAFALRKNHARIRYGIWLAASLKFLVPFALLITFGSHPAQPRVSTPAQTAVYSAIEGFSQPFVTQETLEIPQPTLLPNPVKPLHWLPPTLVTIWLGGVIVVLLKWGASWIRVSLIMRRSLVLTEGPEVVALCRMQASLALSKPIRLVLSEQWMEPGIFGILRPALIWPEGISEHLDDKHIDAILAHEICHVRRRDNLTAMVHMLVEAIFWFHPLVWWVGKRLKDERERACDEGVRLLCPQPHVYAESILRVCKFCSGSPLACVSGITGSDLKRRVAGIMTGGALLRMSWPRKLLLFMAAVAAVVGPILLGQAKLAQPDHSQSTQGTQTAIFAEDLTGSWQGTFKLPANAPSTAKAPRVLIKVTRDGAQGAPYKGTIYLLGPRALAAPAIQVHGSEVSFALPLLGNGMTYVGTLSADGKTMIGGLKPPNGAGPAIGLNLTHVGEEDAWAVPEAQTPMAKDAHPKFAVVTVKPSPPNVRFQLGPQGHKFVQIGMTVDDMIGLAYAMHVDQIIGAPDWFKTEKWDIEGVPDTPGHPNSPQSEDLTHDLLATRFGMKFHYEERNLSAYVITVAKGGPKLQPTAAGPDDDPGPTLRIGNATLQNMTIANFAKWFQTYVLDRPVIDRTGLTGHYDFTLKWAPDESQFLQGREPGAPPGPPLPDDIAAQPAIKDAMLQQLGLKMEVMKTPVKVMVIDHAERPGAN